MFLKIKQLDYKMIVYLELWVSKLPFESPFWDNISKYHKNFIRKLKYQSKNSFAKRLSFIKNLLCDTVKKNNVLIKNQCRIEKKNFNTAGTFNIENIKFAQAIQKC